MFQKHDTQKENIKMKCRCGKNEAVWNEKLQQFELCDDCKDLLFSEMSHKYITSIGFGDIYVNAGGDGIDSNGYVYINGGKTIVDGPTNNGNGALDSGISFTVTGGEALAVGSSGMAETFGAKSTVNNISIYLSSVASAGSKIEFKDKSGNVILEHTSAKEFTNIAAASPKFVLGETYILYINDEVVENITINNVTTTNRSQGGPGGQKQGGPGQNMTR